MEIGEKIKEIRESIPMTQSELAEKLSLSVHTISKYEQGQRHPKLKQLEKIAKALDVSVNDLMTKETMLEITLNRFNDKIDRTITKGSEYSLNYEKQCKFINFLYDQLNDIGREKVISYMSDLLESEKYRNEK